MAGWRGPYKLDHETRARACMIASFRAPTRREQTGQSAFGSKCASRAPSGKRRRQPGHAPNSSARIFALDCYDWHRDVIPYGAAWKWQQEAVASMLLDDNRQQPGKLAILQHKPVLTLGAGSSLAHLNFDVSDPPLPLVRTERGGEVTYHGPGQLVLYPVIDLQSFRPDLHWYLRSLEEVVIRALRAVSGVDGKRTDGLTGVWVGDEKVAAVGIRARRWVAYHGVALNVDMDLSPYELIVPCGIADRSVTSVKMLLGKRSAKQADEEHLLTLYAEALLQAFAEVFNVRLNPVAAPPPSQ